MESNDNRSTGCLQPPQFPIQGLDADLPTAQQIGYAIADAQLIATQRSYQRHYDAGIHDFLKAQASEDALKQAEQLGAHLAAMQIEERRQTLIRVGVRTGAIALPPYCLALLFGFNPAVSVAVLLPALTMSMIQQMLGRHASRMP